MSKWERVKNFFKKMFRGFIFVMFHIEFGNPRKAKEMLNNDKELKILPSEKKLIKEVKKNNKKLSKISNNEVNNVKD